MLDAKYIDEYLQDVNYRNTSSLDTEKSYRLDLNDFLAFLNSQTITEYNQVDKVVASSYISYLHNTKKLSTTSIARHYGAINGFYQFLIVKKVVTNNPFSIIHIGKIKRKLPEILSFEQVETLLNSIDTSTSLGIRNKALLELLYSSGMRVSEITSLTLNDILPLSYQIQIKGKGSKIRTVFYNHTSYCAIENYLKIRSSLAKNNDWLFVNNNGTKLTSRGVEFILDKQMKNAGLYQKAYPHLLRHSFATHMLDAGADIQTISLLLGHSNLSTTQIYTHVSLAKMQQTYQDYNIRMQKGDK